MKRIVLILIVLSIIGCVSAQTAVLPQGSGTKSDPFQISTLSNLFWIATRVNNDLYEFQGEFFIQTADINAFETQDWNNEQGWIPIGYRNASYSPKFRGYYDGLGHNISGLYINRPEATYGYSDYEPSGLFGNVDSACISNLSLLNVNIVGDLNVGAFVGNNRFVQMCNCYASGTVKGNNYVGGIVGNGGYSLTILNCHSDVDVTRSEASEGDMLGSFIGCTNHTRIEKCHARGLVTYLSSTTPSNKGFIGCGDDEGYTFFYANYFDSQSTGQSEGYGAAPLTPSQMQQPSNFDNWDFNVYWTIGSQGYPVLRNGMNLIKPSGVGTEEAPYLITSVDHLKWIMYRVNDFQDRFKDVYLYQNNDIDLSITASWNNGKGWLPIGVAVSNFIDAFFEGFYDGQNHQIAGLGINRPDESAIGLFGLLKGSVSDLHLVDVNIAGLRSVGGLAGDYHDDQYPAHSIIGCTVSGAVTGSGETTGGLLGYVHGGAISDCGSSVTVSGVNDVGGLIGKIYSGSFVDVSGCYSTGNVLGNLRVGGIGGYLDHAHLTDCWTTGTITGIGGVGGMIGQGYESVQILKCFNAASVIGEEKVGGVVGSGYRLNIQKSLNRGQVKGTTQVGGLVGYVWDYIHLYNSYNSGQLTVVNLGYNYQIGGVIGECINGTIFNNFNTGSIRTENGDIIQRNGFIGSCGTCYLLQDCYYDIEASGQNNGTGATPKTTAEMHTQATFTGWDFSSIWQMNPNVNSGYPSFRWQNNTEVDDENMIPDINSLSLYSYPNPFRTSTAITFVSKKSALVSLNVYNIRGQRIRTIADGFFTAGNHQLRWDGLSDSCVRCATGVYFIRLECDAEVETQRLLLLK